MAKFAFIPCESGATPRQIGLESRKKIRSQAMRSSWAQKKGSKGQKPWSGQLTGPNSNDLRHASVDCDCPAVSPVTIAAQDSFDEYQDIGQTEHDLASFGHEVLQIQRQYDTLREFQRQCDAHNSSVCQHKAWTLSQRLEEVHLASKLYVQPQSDGLHSDYEAEDFYVCERSDSDSPDLLTSSPSAGGVDPFTSTVAPMNLRMHSYLQYYFENVLPVLHPYAEQTALLKQNILTHLNRSPLVLYSTLSIAALRVDNYGNKYDELLLFSKWSDSQLPVPHSFRFKTKTVQLLLSAMQDPNTSRHDIVFALICLTTYELLVDNYSEARTHLRGLRHFLHSNGGLQNICAADIKNTETMAEMRKVVREMEKYAEHYAGEYSAGDVPGPIPDETALCRRLAAYSRFPTLIGKSPAAPEGVNWFAVENESAGLLDEMAATECFWHMGCRREKSSILKALIGTDGSSTLAEQLEIETHDEECYSVVNGLDQIPGWDKGKFALAQHTMTRPAMPSGADKCEPRYW